MSVSLEIQQKVAEWRTRARDGTLTIDEMKEAITSLRAERQSMPPAKSRAAKPKVNADDLLSELGL
jgi:pyruvate/2-oxoglutarate dehydrogenase complex dihydrolipoamide acyltransferase (E2) component